MPTRILGLYLAAAIATAALAGVAAPATAGDTTELSAAKKVVVKKTVVVRKTVVRRNVTVHRNVVRRGVVVRVGYSRGYRAWVRRPYYGTALIGAVALGTVIAVSAPHVVPAAPGSNACWFWSDPAEVNGYWDYCMPP